MQKLNSVLGDACRKIGLKKGGGKPPREASFLVQALGLAGMPVSDVNKQDSKRAVVDLVQIWHREQCLDIVLTISAKKGVKLKDRKGNQLLSYKMYDIANCTILREFPEIFVFTAKHSGSTNCHAFYCSDVTQAEAICLAMSGAFAAAFAAWMRRAEEHKVKGEKREKQEEVSEQHKQRKASLDDNDNSNRRQLLKGRRPSIMSNASAFSFNSQADEVFQSLISVEEEEENLDAVLLRRGSLNWEEIKQDENVQIMMLGQEIEWDNQTEC